jgi:hypothetical protein
MNPYGFLDLDKMFGFEFNYINQHDLPGIDKKIWENHISIDRLGSTKTIDPTCLNVFDFSQNFSSGESMKRLSDILSQHQIKHIILSSNPSVDTDSVFYFPVFYFYGLQNWINEYSQVFDHKKIYNISCLNKGAHGHRIQNYVTLIEKNYDAVLSSWIDVPGDGLDPTPDALAKYQKLKEQKIIPKLDPLPINFKSVHGSIQHDAYRAAYIHIIVETQVQDTIFISEKTWKSVASGQLFFMVGCLGTIGYLRDLGVDVFDDIIDHSYDSDPDWVSRINRMHDSLAQLMQQDLSTVYEQTQDRRQQNQKLFFEGKFGMHYLDRIKSIVAMQGNN